jgi:peptidoglycan/LPS O-acetylase OafA/YrhL
VEPGVHTSVARLADPAPNPQKNKKAHLPALTGLRFVLALWVIIHHLTGPGMMLDEAVRSLPEAAANIIRSGYLAVGTFFVLSGFVLARSYSVTCWDRKRLLRYGAARFARIYPVYLLSLLVVSPFIVMDRAPQKGFLIADYALLLQGWTGSLPVGWNTPAWSLSCEVFFYLCFPLAVLYAGRMKWRSVVAVAAFTCVLPKMLLAFGVSDMCKPIVHLGDFVIGMAAARAFDLLGGRLNGRGHWLYLPAAALSVFFIARPGMLPELLSLNSWLRPLNAALLVGLAVGGGRLAGYLSSRVIVYLGKASYSMYILHVPLLWWSKRAGAAGAVVYLVLVVGVSAAVFQWIEEPANRWLRGRLQ